MVRLGGKTALLFKWAAGPSGKPPQDVRWMWGTWGRAPRYRPVARVAALSAATV
jgi:hypothetical protein